MRLADPGGERGRTRGDRVQIAPATQRRWRIVDREEQLDDVSLTGHRVQPELELGDDAEVAAAAAQAPEQVRVTGLVDMQPVAVGGDQLVRLHVVARQPEPAREPAHAAAERQPADAGVGDVARGRGQSMLHRGAIQRAEQRAALHPCATALGIDADAAHRSQVDHQPAVGDAQPEHAVPSAAHADLEVALAAVPDRLGHVVRVRAAHDRARPAVDHRVPHRPCLVVPRGAVLQEPAFRRSTHRRAMRRRAGRTAATGPAAPSANWRGRLTSSRIASCSTARPLSSKRYRWHWRHSTFPPVAWTPRSVPSWLPDIVPTQMTVAPSLARCSISKWASGKAFQRRSTTWR